MPKSDLIAECVYYDEDGHVLPYIIVIAIKPISLGQELLVDYGGSYFAQVWEGGGIEASPCQHCNCKSRRSASQF